MKKIKIDKDKCTGCGTCTVLAPKTFKLGKDNRASVIKPPGDNEATIKQVIDSCPVDAIEYAD